MRRAAPPSAEDDAAAAIAGGDAGETTRPMLLCCTPVLGEPIAQRRAPRRAGVAAPAALPCKNCIARFCTHNDLQTNEGRGAPFWPKTRDIHFVVKKPTNVCVPSNARWGAARNGGERRHTPADSLAQKNSVLLFLSNAHALAQNAEPRRPSRSNCDRPLSKRKFLVLCWWLLR